MDAAIKEAVYVLDTLGADGIKLATNSRGQYVGDAALDTLMQILNERHAIVMLHPHKPSPVNDGIIATTPLAVYEYPAETTRTVVNPDCPEYSGPVSGFEVRRTALRFISAAGPSAHEGGISGHGGERAYGTD